MMPILSQWNRQAYTGLARLRLETIIWTGIQSWLDFIISAHPENTNRQPNGPRIIKIWWMGTIFLKKTSEHWEFSTKNCRLPTIGKDLYSPFLIEWSSPFWWGQVVRLPGAIVHTGVWSAIGDDGRSKDKGCGCSSPSRRAGNINVTWFTVGFDYKSHGSI